MSQATDAHSTSERAAPTRRTLLCTAPVVLAAAIPLTLAEGALAGASQQPSREFLKYRQRHAEWLALFDGDEPPVGSPEYAALMDLQGVRGDAMWAAIDPIMTRTARSWDDVIELARVVYDQLYDEVGKHSHREDIEHALLQAIFDMAEGGALNS